MLQIELVHSALVLVRHIAILERTGHLLHGARLRHKQSLHRIELSLDRVRVQTVPMLAGAGVADHLHTLAGRVLMRSPIEYPHLVEMQNVVQLDGVPVGGHNLDDSQLCDRDDQDTIQRGLTDEDQMWCDDDRASPHAGHVFAAQRFAGAGNDVAGVDAMVDATHGRIVDGDAVIVVDEEKTVDG